MGWDDGDGGIYRLGSAFAMVGGGSSTYTMLFAAERAACLTFVRCGCRRRVGRADEVHNYRILSFT